jgi:cytochrome c oxidase assembly protein subunit 15
MRRPSFRSLAAVTAGLTFALILVGIYTKATAAGLACNAQWPGTNGFLGLLPADVPCFIEWSHRALAMVTGFAILGTAVAAWRGGLDRRIRYATAIALAVLPVQVLLGANTVFNYGAVAQVAHHGAALVIFTGLLVATTLAFWGPTASTDADAAGANPGDRERDARTTGD